MVRCGNDWIRSARRGAALAVFLLSAPLAASADPAGPAKSESAKPEAAVVAKEEPAPATPAAAKPPLNLTVPKIQHLEDGTEPPAAARIPEVVVEASVPAPPPSVTHRPCGFASILDLVAHPAGPWRELAPLPAHSDTAACSKATAIGTDLPEALGPMHWYE